MLQEALYKILYDFIRAVQGMCIAAYSDPRLYTKEDHGGILVPVPHEFVDAICTEGLDYLRAGSEFDSVSRASLVRCTTRRSTFDVALNAVADEAEHQQELSC